jgi:hypothetical protein
MDQRTGQGRVEHMKNYHPDELAEVVRLLYSPSTIAASQIPTTYTFLLGADIPIGYTEVNSADDNNASRSSP